MIIQRTDDCFFVKIYKEYLGDFDFFNKNAIKKLFQKILIKILDKYHIKGFLEVDVYMYNEFGLIIEMRDLSSSFDEIDMHIHFHIDSVFLTEIDIDDIYFYKDIYYYNNKFYKIYDNLIDSSIIYKNSEHIIKKGIKIC